MKDDQDFNINFVSMIESNPCLYDSTSAQYSNRNLQEKTWEKISKEIKEPVSDCKERWKNLRGSFTRHLKYNRTSTDSARKRKRPYYLAEYLTFLLPFTTTRKKKSSKGTFVPSYDFENGDNKSDHDKNDTVEIFYSEAEDLQNESPIPSSSNKRKLPCDTNHKSSVDLTESSCDIHSDSCEDVNKSLLEYFQRKKARIENASNSEQKHDDPDVLFLLSVLPDMKQMNDSQKRRFKVGILTSAGSILDENTNHSDIR